MNKTELYELLDIRMLQAVEAQQSSRYASFDCLNETIRESSRVFRTIVNITADTDGYVALQRTHAEYFYMETRSC